MKKELMEKYIRLYIQWRGEIVFVIALLQTFFLAIITTLLLIIVFIL